jgi:N-acyl-D-amino-acid deacylase
VACQLPRNGANLLTALAEILTIQKKTKIPLLLTNLGVEGKNSTTIQELLVETITEARSLGYSIHGSSTFFPLRSTTLVDFLPDWSTKDGIPTLVKRLQDPLIRGKISQHLQHYQSQDRNFFQNLKISALPNPMDQDNIGMDLEAAFMTTKERRDFFQYLLKLLERNQFDVKLLCFQRNEQLINFLHKQDWIIPATSSPSLNLPGDQTDSLIHPATFSTFPQFLKFVQQTEPERLFLRWKKYLEIVSSLLKIENRGKIAPGFYADLTLFDAKKLAVKNSWKTPWLTHPAISTVLVNGRVCWQNGKVHDSKKGQIIRSQFVKM